ncbi:hypothetical protein [Polynucleobacter sp. Fuers-14]|uniref:hypothetical protein n=1 Tax=Polynucleobacter sp. Fuers-14 TaxID=1758364 RepID=UPI001C0C05B7|nr:hypothetical protein [Polynucleobacter sp. Fuers-14]MBU3641076.1 hypothetical protein [Polynucleobacter sp. Fuers-14]
MKLNLISKSLISLIILVTLSLVFYFEIVVCEFNFCTINLNAITFYPYTDFSENIVSSFNVANGYTFGVDFSQPHFPGIYILYGLIFKIFGLIYLIPGNLTTSVLILFSIFITLSIAIIYSTIAMGFWRGLCSVLLSLVLFYSLKLYLPMSETLAFWIATPLLYSNLRLLNKEKKISLVDITGPILVTYFGIGFPGLLILPIFLYIILTIKDHNTLPTKSTYVYSILFILIIFFSIFVNVDLSELYFWTIDINTSDVKPSLLKNIIINIINLGQNGDLYSYGTSIVIITFIILFLRIKHYINSNLTAVYLILMLLSFYWRMPDSYKVLPALSLLFAIIFYTARNYNFDKLLFYSLFIILLVISSKYIFNKNTFDKLNVERYQVSHSNNIDFASYGICKSSAGRNQTNCYCMQTMVFGPQLYILNDILQCKYQISTWSSRMGLNSKYKEIVLKSIYDGKSAFYIPPKNYMDGDLALEGIVLQIKNNLSCIHLSNGFELCKPKE